MNGPVVTCSHTIGAIHTVQYEFHCRKDGCPWFSNETSGANQCDWRDEGRLGRMCGHWQAQVEALKFLAEYTVNTAREWGADL